MRVILSAAGRAFLRDSLIAFLALSTGILAAPNLNRALALAGAASIAAIAAGIRGLRVFVPGFSEAVARALHVPLAYAEVVITGLTTLVAGFIATALTVLEAPDLNAARAAGLAGILAIGTALVRLVSAWLTPGEGGAGGIKVPPQPVPREALPPVMGS